MTWFSNAKVFTGTGEDDWADSFRVEDGRFTWVGRYADRPTGQGMDERDEPVVDLGGRTVLPGLLDVHTHPAMLATLAGMCNLVPPRVSTLEQVLDELRHHPDLGAGPDRWVEGWGFDESADPHGRRVTNHDLDTVARDQPVVARRSDGHSVVVNSHVLALAGITRDTPDPTGGRIGRHPNGEPNGLLAEPAAMDLALARRPPPTHDDLVDALAGLDEHFLARGITGGCDLYATYVDNPVQAYLDAAQRGLSLDVGLYLAWHHVHENLTDATDLANQHRTGQVRVSGIKLFMDGAYSDRTAWTEEPYPDSCDHGLPTASDRDVLASVEFCRAHDLQLAIHAMGDRAINRVLDLTADTTPWLGTVPSIRIDHATLFSPSMIDRVAAATMRYAVVSHTIFMFAEWRNYERNLSPSQFAMAYPIRSFYERIPATALASDLPATSWPDADNVFVSIRAAVDRRSHTGADMGQEQAVTVPQAVLLYTGRASRVAGHDDQGRIETGCAASFVVLDRDVFTVPTHEIDQVGVAETWVRGELRYRST